MKHIVRGRLEGKRIPLFQSRSVLSTLLVSAVLLLSVPNASFAQVSSIKRSNWLLGVLFKLEKMKQTAVANTRKYERGITKSDNAIRRAEDILRQARQANNVRAEDIASRALTMAQAAKKTNEDNYYLAHRTLENTERSMITVRRVLGNQLKVEESNNTDNTEKKQQQKLTLPPYFEAGLPPVNCAAGLKALHKKNCYCARPNRPPICTADGKRLKEKDRVYVFSWMIQFADPGRGLLSNDGTHIGTYKSYDDAYTGCMQEAKGSGMDITDRIGGTVVLGLKCVPE